MRKYCKLIICFALVAAISVGATLAYLQANVGKKTNNFQSSKKISGVLLEPGWGFSNNEHWNYLPGENHTKDPQIKINADSVNAYVAIKIDFLDEKNQKINYKMFSETYATILSESVNQDDDKEFNLIDWDEIKTNDQSKFFVYKAEVIAGGDPTSPLFDKVFVNKTIKTNEKNELPSFRIELTGYAVQSHYNALEDAKTQLFEMAY